jgi:hypothetical protein
VSALEIAEAELQRSLRCDAELKQKVQQMGVEAPAATRPRHAPPPPVVAVVRRRCRGQDHRGRGRAVVLHEEGVRRQKPNTYAARRPYPLQAGRAGELKWAERRMAHAAPIARETFPFPPLRNVSLVGLMGLYIGTGMGSISPRYGRPISEWLGTPPPEF